MRELTNRELQLFSLEILKDIHSFCAKKNITYSLAYGTLIGAVRHHGFIPWDNDIDIIMPRPEYEKFIHSYTSDKFELAFFGDKKHDCLMTYARVFDKKRTIAKNYNWINEKIGVWIDIFPLDGVPDNKLDFVEMYNSYQKIWGHLITKKIQFNRFCELKNFFEKIKLLFRKIRHLNGLGGHKRYKQYNELIQKIAYGKTNYCSQLTVMDNGPVEHIPISFFSELTTLRFEDAAFSAIKKYDVVLKSLYGDYMQLPIETQRIPHQVFIKFYWKENVFG